ncbi:hypothetical protein FGO68_gene2173 [Halteria grandinella]|uniref:Uncharacterized protein n=1 Tax=Halteria grandinella TaxID=5974 RepID=A0A8J8NJI8_HALGN|nr:hypothetical protein FGO68_gene2173 [Halteria grandinella]
MRFQKSCICLTLKQGALVSICFDMLKILISLFLLLIFLWTGDDRTKELRTQTIQAPQKLKDLKTRENLGPSSIQVIVIFAGDACRYSVAGVIGVVMIVKKWSALYQGTYFWVKFISSFLNVFSGLMMVTLTQLPFSDMILSICSFALDQYFCLVIYSMWQSTKELELYILEHGEAPPQGGSPNGDQPDSSVHSSQIDLEGVGGQQEEEHGSPDNGVAFSEHERRPSQLSGNGVQSQSSAQRANSRSTLD